MIDGIGDFTPFAQLRGDIYGVNGIGRDLDGSEDFVDDEEKASAIVRGVALGGIEYRYPFVASTGNVTRGRADRPNHRAARYGGQSAGNSQRRCSEPRLR